MVDPEAIDPILIAVSVEVVLRFAMVLAKAFD